MEFDATPYRHVLRFPVRFSDLDAMGHVNNARYLTYFEEGRSHWFRACVGMPIGSIDFPVVVARIEIDYLAPVAWGEEVEVFHRCSEIGQKSLNILGVITVDRRPVAKYRCVVVYFDYETQKSCPVRPEDAKKIRKFEPALQ